MVGLPVFQGPHARPHQHQLFGPAHPLPFVHVVASYFGGGQLRLGRGQFRPLVHQFSSQPAAKSDIFFTSRLSAASSSRTFLQLSHSRLTICAGGSGRGLVALTGWCQRYSTQLAWEGPGQRKLCWGLCTPSLLRLRRGRLGGVSDFGTATVPVAVAFLFLISLNSQLTHHIK